MFIPAINMEKARYIFNWGAIDSSEYVGTKVAVVQRQVSEFNKNAMKTMKDCGLKIIYDLDDNVWNLPSFNPGKKVFDQHRDGFWQCASLADVLTVSTRGLSAATRTGFNFNTKEILIVPNAMDFNLFKYRPLTRNDEYVVIGWGGSNTHSEDVNEVFNIVMDVLTDNPVAKMEIVGAPALNITRDITKDSKGREVIRATTKAHKILQHNRCEFRSWVPVGEYPNRISCWGWDISIAPLFDNRFNRSKSNIKMLEAAALHIPCVVSDVQPYREFCELGGKDLTWLLCTSEKQWKEKLTELVNDKDRRTYLGELMYKVANEWFNIDKIKMNWYHAFNAALSA